MTSIPIAIYRFSENNFKTLLSQQEKTNCGFFIPFPKCAWNSEYSETKEEYPSLIVIEDFASERDIFLSV